ncbi:MAG: hypothetical protein AAFP17_10035 [Pseudomonadota bacterium]
MLQPLDWVQITILMVFGGTFALVGLYMLLRPPASDGETKIELFGLKFNASSGGLLVFAVGCAFLASPTFVPKAIAPSQPASPASRSAAAAAALAPTGGEAPALVNAPAVLAAGAEVEPNDHPRGANIIEVGKPYEGKVANGDIDIFSAPLNEGTRKVRYVWRLLEGEGRYGNLNACVMTLLDAHGNRLELENWAPGIGEAQSKLVQVGGNASVGVKVAAALDVTCGYEIELQYE